ncbi:MAG: DNA methyltransferase [Bacillota bacterium]
MNNKRVITKYGPTNFVVQNTTVWNFPDRGDWATHNSSYRGNCTPYVPRNLLHIYTKPGDIVLDPFAGSGTALIECKLLGRNAIGIDCNPKSVELINNNLNFDCPNEGGIDVIQGDACDLSFIGDEFIDFIFMHPPYADIIKYSANGEKDLSLCSVEGFYEKMQLVANESYRVLKKGKICTMLIGDIRRNMVLTPLGDNTRRLFEKAGFTLKEIIMKEQHNCRGTYKWMNKGKESKFLLLMHEHLYVFIKK